MSDTKISDLPAAGSVDGSELLPIVQSATTKSATLSQVAGLAGGYWDATVQVSGSNFTTSSTTPVDITGLSFTAEANATYEIEATLYGSGADSNGARAVVAYSGTHSANENYYWVGMTSQTACSSAGNAIGTLTSLSFWTGAGNQNVRLYAVIHTTGTGNITVQGAKTTSGTMTVSVGSILKVKKLA